MKYRINNILKTLACSALLAVASSAHAQSWPTKPVRILVGFAAGGIVDQVARLIANQLAKDTGQSVVVENKTGAGGTLAVEAAAKAAPDGHTLVLGEPAGVTINPTLMKVSYDALKDLTAVAQVASLPQIMVASKSLGVTSVKELVAQNKGKKLAYGTPGTGTIQHLTMVEFRKASTLDLTHAPYRGGAQVMADLLGGHLPLGMLTVPSVASSVKAGTVVALGVLSKNRVPLLPDVPTLAEQGFPQFTQDIWVGFFAPSATPKALVETMSRALQKAASSSDFETAMKEVGGPVTLGGSAEFGKMVRDDFSFWAKVVKDSGVRPDQ